MKCKIANNLNSSESVVAFVAWLTSRDKSITFGGHHNASSAANAVEIFINSQFLPDVRNDFSNRIKPYPD